MGTQSGFVWTTMEWLFAVLLYPGLLFGAALVLASEWLLAAFQPLLTRRAYRARSRPRHPLQPLYDTLRLATRRSTGDITYYVLRITYLSAPVLVLAFLPFPGNPIAHVGNVFLVLTLLAVQPVCGVILHLNIKDPLGRVLGGRDVGRLVTGLVSTLVVVAALVEASGGRSLIIADLTALTVQSPPTGGQALVRLLAGAALLVALPWWLQRRVEDTQESASVYIGQKVQRAALAAFWAVLVLPMPGNFMWALVMTIGGSLFAYVAMRLIAERVTPTLRESDAARLAWATALPIAALSFVIALS